MPKFTVDVYYVVSAPFKVRANGPKHAAQKGLDLFNASEAAENIDVDEVCATPEGGNLQHTFGVDSVGREVKDWIAIYGATND